MNLLNEYPLPVAYFDYGPHHVLIWWCESTHHHAIVAKTEAGILQALRVLLERNEWRDEWRLGIEVYWRVNIIAPPEAIQLKWAKRQYQEELQHFQFWVAQQVEDYQETRGELPPGLSPCLTFKHPLMDVNDGKEEDWDENDWDDNDREWANYVAEHHSECVHCGGRRFVLPQAWDWDSLFEQSREDFHKDHPYWATKIEARPVPKEAPTNNHDMTLVHAAKCDYRQGFKIVEPDNFGSQWGSSMPILFFFEGEQEPLPSSVTNLLTEAQKARAASEEKNKAAAEVQDQQKQEAGAERTAKLFNRLLEQHPKTTDKVLVSCMIEEPVE